MHSGSVDSHSPSNDVDRMPCTVSRAARSFTIFAGRLLQPRASASVAIWRARHIMFGTSATPEKAVSPSGNEILSRAAHALAAQDVVRELGSDEKSGLTEEEAAERLRSTVRSGDTVGRLGR